MIQINNKPATVYLPRLATFRSEDTEQCEETLKARLDLVVRLRERGMHVDDIFGIDAWINNVIDHTAAAHAFLFPPLASLPRGHRNFKKEVAQRWFEFFSLSTAAHIGGHEVYYDGIAKPCLAMDPDGQWQVNALELLRYLKRMGMFNLDIDDIVQIAPPPAKEGDYEQMNENAAEKLEELIVARKGRKLKDVVHRFPNKEFASFRTPIRRHHFGVAFFGSASTKEQSYINAVSSLAQAMGERGWRMITGAGYDGCMGAADEGFELGKRAFNARYPDAKYKPAHVGVSTLEILRLEGPPKHLDQLVIAEDIYERMKIMFKGQKDPSDRDFEIMKIKSEMSGVEKEKAIDAVKKCKRVRNAVKVVFIAPGGTGTLHELATMLQLKTNGTMLEGKRIVLLNFPSHLKDGKRFWEPLIEIAQHLGFDDLLEVANTPEEAIEITDREYQQWLDRNPDEVTLPHPVFNPL